MWFSNRKAAQKRHGERHQTCLAHLARDIAYSVEVSEDPAQLRLQRWLWSVFDLARVADLTTSTFSAMREALNRHLSKLF